MVFSGVPPAVLSSSWGRVTFAAPSSAGSSRPKVASCKALVEIVFVLNGETYLGPDAAAVRLFHLHHVEVLLTVIEFILEDLLKDYCDAGHG